MPRRRPAPPGPRARRGDPRGDRTAGDEAPADRRRELHLARRAGRARLAARQQVRRGLSRRPPPRRLRDRRRRRADRGRPGQGAVRRRTRQRPVPLGSSAVLAAYAALLRPGDTVLAMGLPHGGHLTHGSPANFSGRWFDFVGYGVDAESGLIDYEQVRALARTHRPKAIVCGSISYPRHIDYAAFREIADEVGRLSDRGRRPSDRARRRGSGAQPVPYADVVCATTHKVLRGPRGGMLLCGAELAERVDRAVFPFTQGGAADAHDRRQGRRLRRGGDTGLHGVRPSGGRQRPGAGGGPGRRGAGRTTGGTDTHLDHRRSRAARRGRTDGARPALRGGNGAGQLRAAHGEGARACGSAPRR